MFFFNKTSVKNKLKPDAASTKRCLQQVKLKEDKLTILHVAKQKTKRSKIKKKLRGLK